ncbi:hypothetical protein SDRG_05779 [Saprolegnia diclina VS20]|uniref:Uncharacterized protein n=1 Tax=Saprolegnia diclina (strain VS20) TaxID=1156394 RepID=T0QSK7_SAPDV|nr:hypothetical protein SDRG_05779 [Saprolegnia diclina VS20]EQC36955.1 hypothetical protein SDRG_05779 [Saprolegnia diclina VS20]|eukprot:XP_008609736.1 hypothetical protein SDRG_05779 [Saprolegnia diclina VS20]
MWKERVPGPSRSVFDNINANVCTMWNHLKATDAEAIAALEKEARAVNKAQVTAPETMPLRARLQLSASIIADINSQCDRLQMLGYHSVEYSIAMLNAMSTFDWVTSRNLTTW